MSGYHHMCGECCGSATCGASDWQMDLLAERCDELQGAIDD